MTDAKRPEAGDEAPDFSLAGAGGEKHGLASYKGKKLALYFYPKDDTSGCTKEAIDFNGLRDKFAKAGTSILGVSPDSEKSHEPALHARGVSRGGLRECAARKAAHAR